jgi:hypothetical protein
MLEVREELHPSLAHDALTDKFLIDRGVVLTKTGRDAFLSAVLSFWRPRRRSNAGPAGLGAG